jgi:hypothetical protein
MFLIPLLASVFYLSISQAQAFPGLATPEKNNYSMAATNRDPSMEEMQVLRFFNELNRVRENLAGPTRQAKERIVEYLGSQDIDVKTWVDIENKHRVSYVVNDRLKSEVLIDVKGKLYTFDSVKGDFKGDSLPSGYHSE